MQNSSEKSALNQTNANQTISKSMSKLEVDSDTSIIMGNTHFRKYLDLKSYLVLTI